MSLWEVLAVLLLALVLVPFLAYVVAKMVTLGILKARKFMEQNDSDNPNKEHD